MLLIIRRLVDEHIALFAVDKAIQFPRTIGKIIDQLFHEGGHIQGKGQNDIVVFVILADKIVGRAVTGYGLAEGLSDIG